MLFHKKLFTFVRKPIPFPNWNHLKIRMETSRKAREAADQLIQGSRLKSEYFVMCLLSGLIATLGILLNDIPLLIAAMVLAPLLNPVLSFAAGVSLLNARLTIYAATSFFWRDSFRCCYFGTVCEVVASFWKYIRYSRIYYPFSAVRCVSASLGISFRICRRVFMASSH